MSKAQWIAENLKTGEIYAGLILGEDDAPDHHLILLPGEAEEVTFKNAQAWAKKQGGDLPTRREQSMLFANCKAQFKPAWYWSCEVHEKDASCAWGQLFLSGYQDYGHVYDEWRARAVRRLII